MGLRSLRRRPRATSESLALLLLALLILVAALVADVPSSDPRLSVIYTVDDEGLPVERPLPKPDSVLQAVAPEGVDLQSPSGAAEPAAPLPAIRLVEAAALGGPSSRAPPQS
jgi:hypothetical protein